MKIFVRFFIALILITTASEAFAQAGQNDTLFIDLKDYGLYRTRKHDCVELVKKALNDLEGSRPKVLTFSPGEYHFYPENCERREYFESNTTDVNPKVCAFLFENVHNLVIDGRGATLIFHEQMQPFTFDSCTNIVLKNLRIDWEQPLTAQAEVLRVNEQFMDLAFEPDESNLRIEEDRIFFREGDALREWYSTMEFDREGHYIVPQTGDNGCLGNNWQQYRAMASMPGIVRLYNNFDRKPQKGNFLVLRYSTRAHAGIFIKDSKNIRIEEFLLFHATGLGVLAQFSEDLTFDGYKAISNLAKGRYFGGGDDGLQVSNCKGKIAVRNCEFAGLMDDPINVHGTSVKIIEIMPGKRLKCRFMENQSVGLNWGHPGDKISFIENEGMFSLGSGEVASFQPLDKKDFVLTFKGPLPTNLEVGDALENLSWSPEVEIVNNQFKSSRARGVLVSTPGKVLIENNVFESSGSAILISGDANGWFESGAVRDVTIRNNFFTERCNTSPYQFCEAVISVYPIIPKPEESKPAFHQNIRIENNRFQVFDYPILFARSVDGISFTGNEVFRSYNFQAFHKRQYNFSFEFCKNVKISGNQFPDDLPGKNILLKKTPENELHTDLADSFHVEIF